MIEEICKANSFVRTCKIHGDLTIENTKTNYEKLNGETVKKWLICRLCSRERDKKYRVKDREAKKLYLTIEREREE